VFDVWMKRNYPDLPFCRYADDGIVHCRTKSEVLALKEVLKARFGECKLELHPEKTRIVYCKDKNRKEEHPTTSFDFLGFTFRPRLTKTKEGKFFVNVNSRHNRASVFRRNEASTKGSKTILDTSFKTSFSPPFWS
jgi:RNA-directed DNA polymerase